MSSLRRTKIVATLGPATDDLATLTEMVRTGVDVVRLNFSHGTQDDHRRRLELVRAADAATGKCVGVLADLGGPKIRIESFREGRVRLQEGASFTLDTALDPRAGTVEAVGVAYKDLPRDVHPGDTLLLADGQIVLDVQRVDGTRIESTVRVGGELSDRKGLNRQGGGISAPALSDKDRDDVRFAADNGIDYVAVSFARSADDINEAKILLRQWRGQARVVAKIERQEAVANLASIIEATDAVMVARGDLGVEMGYAELTGLQKTIIHQTRNKSRAVITATQMLESMVHRPQPTRAETSDVANAILDGTDALMLSAETAIGDYPIEAVKMMDRIARVVEASEPSIFHSQTKAHAGTAQAVARAASELARELRVRAIVVITRTGRTAELLSKNRPSAPMVAFTEEEATARRLALWWGIRCYATTFLTDTDEMIAHIEGELLRFGLAAAGDAIILVGSAPLIAHGRTNFLKVHRVREESPPAARTRGTTRRRAQP